MAADDTTPRMPLSELKRALKELNVPAERLATCIERPDYEALLAEMRAKKNG